MLASFDKLARMLIQERRLEYKNKAVMGGLEKFMPTWVAEAEQEVTTDAERQLIQDVAQALNQYPEISETDRPNYLHRILVKLHKAGESIAEDDAAEAEAKPEVGAVQPVATQPPAETDAEPGADSEPEPEPIQEQISTQEVKPAIEIVAAPEKPARASTPPPPPPPSPPFQRDLRADFAQVGLNSPVTKLPGIKEVMAKKLARLSVQTVGDFLSLYPRRYDDYRSLKPINRLQYGEEVTIIAQVWKIHQRDSRRGQTLVNVTLSDGTGKMEVTWFNQPWLVNRLKPGTQIVVSGKVSEYLGRLTFTSPEWEELDKDLLHTGRIVPVYPLTEGITAKWLRKQVRAAVDYWSSRLTDPLPAESLDRLKLPALDEAIRQIHFPDDWEKLEIARRRLAFDELLLIQLSVLQQRQAWRAQSGRPVHTGPEVVEQLVKALPFELTTAQRRALDEIVADLRQGVPMSRLLQGDVGSGKTVVALAAMVLTVLDKGQAAILAPTEILAEQHFKGMSKLLEPIGQALGQELSIRLLTGSTPAAERRELLDQLANGQVDMLVGTHAIIQSDVEINDLRLAVIDEQHRFGVGQRSALREKGFNPHMLVMTATPIPRTLSLTLYGDLDLSIIDEMPPGRQTIATRWVSPRERERAYSFLQAQIEKGRQAFIICPLVEESDKTEARAAIEEHKRLQTEVFPRLKLGLLHGRMKADEKDKVMTTFRDGQTDILVSTSVVEVGIDVPNASVILIEGANRFGLAQLHQFRGRVGRGEHKSYCLLLADKVTPEVEERLQAVEQTTDGFKLAEKDLEMRGPGEFFGTRQSGLPDLKLVKLSDTKLLELARSEAQLIFGQDPHLKQPQHQLLVQQLENFWNPESDLS
ncbi:MAG: ATP-dependent DNA helicase RecG [Anaerolineae bacterium]|nr:ATP-dependent DNA helicase RecG [Anaerolineae bacterium]